MKRIEAIIRPDKVPDVCTALNDIGQHGVTISAVEGRGGRQAWEHHVRGATYSDTARERSRVEVVVTDEDAARIISAIRNAAVTGRAGDGNIFVHDLADVIRIRTNESGAAAL
jgi:nitrogen regulatory protein P-II 1